MTEWDERFDEVLHGVLPLLPEVLPDTCLRNHGLDSLATIEVLIQLEGAYEVSIPDTMLTADTFATPAALWNVLVTVGAKAEPVGVR